MNNKIYTITALFEKSDKRCFGYYFNFEEAKQAVLENRGNIHECVYTFCVIEEYAPGIHSLGIQKAWFIYDWIVTKKWTQLEESPYKWDNTSNYALG